MKTLAIDTSSRLGAVALVIDGEVKAQLSVGVSARHGETLMPHVHTALTAGGITPHDLDLIVAGLGPGSFTGLRVGISTAMGLALGASVDVVGVCSLAALAESAPVDLPVVALTDARRGEVFMGVYSKGSERLAPINAKPDVAASLLRTELDGAAAVALGDGRSVGEALGGIDGLAWLPTTYDVLQGAHLARIGERHHAMHGPSELHALDPVYVRGADAKKPKPR